MKHRASTSFNESEVNAVCQAIADAMDGNREAAQEVLSGAGLKVVQNFTRMRDKLRSKSNGR